MTPEEFYIQFGLMGYIRNGGGRKWGDPPELDFFSIKSKLRSSTNSSSNETPHVYDDPK